MGNIDSPYVLLHITVNFIAVFCLFELDISRDHDLTCQYRRHVPMFYIRPLKEELVNRRPRIVVYHDIITDSEIAKIKELSTPKVGIGSY
jgi:hypothetical protein